MKAGQQFYITTFILILKAMYITKVLGHKGDLSQRINLHALLHIGDGMRDFGTQ